MKSSSERGVKSPLHKNKSLWGLLMFMDLLAAGGALFLAYWFRIHSGFIPYYAQAPIGDYLRLYAYSIPILILIFRGVHLYDRHDLFYGTYEYIRIVKGCTFYILSVIVISFVIHSIPPSRGWLLGTWILSIGFVGLGRFSFRRCLKMVCRNGNTFEKILIIGASEEARATAERLERTGMVEVAGFLDEFSPCGEEVWSEKVVLGPPYLYREICQRENAILVVLCPDATSWETQREVLRQAAVCRDIEVQIAPGFNELYSAAMRVSFKGNVPLLRFRPGYVNGLDAALKACMDYGLGLFLLVLTAPVMAIFILLLWTQGVRPVFKSFNVLGKNSRPIRIYKFGTGMDVPTSYRSFRRGDSSNLHPAMMTGVGRFLFRTGLDKLPQLFNVLTGKMSIVGPRIVSPEVSSRYGPWLPGILAVKPGLIGIWALRDARDLEQEILMTFHYLKNWSIWDDFAVFGQTVLELLRSHLRTRIVQNTEQTPIDWQQSSALTSGK